MNIFGDCSEKNILPRPSISLTSTGLAQTILYCISKCIARNLRTFPNYKLIEKIPSKSPYNVRSETKVSMGAVCNKDNVSFRQILSSLCPTIFAPSQKMPKINWKTGFLLILEFSASTWKGPKLDFLGQTSHLSRCLKKLRFLVTIFCAFISHFTDQAILRPSIFFNVERCDPKTDFFGSIFLHSNTTTG